MKPCPKSPTKAHHIVFDTPAGITSEGRCRYCQYTVVQPNSVVYRSNWLRVRPKQTKPPIRL